MKPQNQSPESSLNFTRRLYTRFKELERIYAARLPATFIEPTRIGLIGCALILIAATAYSFFREKGSEQPAPNSTVASVASAATVLSPPQGSEDKMPRVNVEDAKKLVAESKAIIIDVRGTDAYKIAHIKGALDIQLNKLESGDFQALPKDKRIIAYCT